MVSSRWVAVRRFLPDHRGLGGDRCLEYVHVHVGLGAFGPAFVDGALQATTDGTLREGFFLDLLRRGFSADEARHQLDIAIDWGRYGELYDFDANSGQLKLERP